MTNVILQTPCLDEQKKIGTFFRTFDNTIAIYKSKLDSLRDLKKAYLHVLFPQAGEAVPKVRFRRFDEPWSIKKLSTFMETSKVKNRQNEFNLTVHYKQPFYLTNSINSIGTPLCSIIATLTPFEGRFGSDIILKSRLRSS